MECYMGEWLYYNFAAGSFHTKELCCALYSTELNFYSKNEKIAFWARATIWGLRGNICTPSIVRWKARVWLPIRHNWCYLLQLRCNKQKSGVGNFQCRFQREGATPTNHCWCQSSRVITLSCGIKMSAVHLSQSMRVTDRWTDKTTTPKSALA